MTVIRKLNLKCPICVAPFPSDVVLSTDLFGKLHTDFLEEAGGPQALAGLVHTCPACGYTGKRPDFDRPERARIDKLRATVAQSIGPQKDPDGPARWLLLARVREIARDSPASLAEAYHCGAWCARLIGDAAREKELLAAAITQYEKALEPGNKPDGQRGYYTYQVGELLRRVGRAGEAAAWYARVPEAASKDMLPKYNAALVRKLAQGQSAAPKDMVDADAIPPAAH